MSIAYSAARRTIASSITKTPASLSSSYRQRFAPAVFGRHQTRLGTNPARFQTRRNNASGYAYEPAPGRSNRTPRETVLLDGCDCKYWLVVVDFPKYRKLSEDKIVNSYVKTLASVLGSEEQAKKKIYSVSTTNYTVFGALISEELSLKVKELPGVLQVLPDSHLELQNKDHEEDLLFFNGKLIPKLHSIGTSSSTPLSLSNLSFRSPFSFNSKHSSLPTRLPQPGLIRIHSRHITYFGPKTDSEDDEIAVPTSDLATKSADGDDSEDSLDTPNWVNPENLDDGMVMIEGCDFEHWLVIMGFPKESKPSNEEMIQSYVSTVTKVVGSEEEAKKKIYSVSTSLYTGFGVALPREIANNLKGLPNVLWVLPDSYIDVPSKDYGGDLYENGKITSRPQYHVPLPKAQWGSDSESESDSENLDTPLNDFDYETEQFNERDKVYEQLKATMEAIKRDSSKSETNGLGVSKEDTQKLFVRLREQMEARSESKAEDSGVTEAPNKTEEPTELHQLFSQAKEEITRLNSDLLDSSPEQGISAKADEAAEEPDKQVPDLNQLKEAMKVFRMQSNPKRDGDSAEEIVGSQREEISALKNGSSKLDSNPGPVGHHPILDALKERIIQNKSRDEADKTVKESDDPKKRSPIEIYSFGSEKAEEQPTSVDKKDGPKTY